MPKFFAYDPVLSGKASSYLVSLPRAKQKAVITLLFQLAEHPAQIGDYPTSDESGRRLENILLGEWHFTYWADHAAKELRIVEITCV
jgi:hypothetical protein